jgi:Flp pilus assembly pilin Flp
MICSAQFKEKLQGGERQMNYLTKAYVRITERKGQSMTEYALILSAVAVVAFATYNSLGNKIGTLLNNVINDL